MSNAHGSPYKTSAIRRAQCRVNQHRYRANTNALIQRLENQVEELTIETARLEGCLDYYSRSKCYQIPRPIDQLSGIQIVDDFFRTYRYGFHCQEPYHCGRLLTPDLTYLGYQSLEEFKVQWYRYESYFNQFEMICQHLEAIVDENIHIVVCQGRVRLQITQITLQYVFPNILSDYDLAQKVLGQVVELSFVVHFDICSHQQRIQAIDADAAYVECVLKLLEDKELAADTMERALLDGVVLLGDGIPLENQINS